MAHNDFNFFLPFVLNILSVIKNLNLSQKTPFLTLNLTRQFSANLKQITEGGGGRRSERLMTKI